MKTKPKTPTNADVRAVLQDHILTLTRSYAEADGEVRCKRALHEIACLEKARQWVPPAEKSLFDCERFVRNSKSQLPWTYKVTKCGIIIYGANPEGRLCVGEIHRVKDARLICKCVNAAVEK